MSAQYFPLTGTTNYIQLAMRPIQLWECVFPKESLQDVMATMGIQDRPKHWKYGDKYLWGLRKALKAYPIPKQDPKAIKRIVFNRDIHVAPIGIKDDIDDPGAGHEHL